MTAPNATASGPTMGEVETFGQQVDKANEPPYMLINYVPGRDKADTIRINQGKFPVRPLPRDSYDTIWKIKGDTLASGTVSAARPLPITDDDVDYIKRKRDAEEYAGYLKWTADRFDMNDPADREYAKKVIPSYFEMREALIDEQIDLSARYAKIRLFGPTSEEDMKIEWMIETDRLSLPKGPIWEPFTWYVQQQNANLGANTTNAGLNTLIANANQSAYRRGLFSPIKPVPINAGGRSLNQFNKGDIKGVGPRYTGPTYAEVPPTDSYGAYQLPNLGLDNRSALYNPVNGALRVGFGVNTASNIAASQAPYTRP